MKRNNKAGTSAIALSAVLALIVFVSYLIISPEITVVHAALNPNSVGANVFVSNTCIPTLNGNTAINFGSVPPGTKTSTDNAITVNNFGNAASNIFVEGGNWVYFTNSFLVSNTFWAYTQGGTANEVANSVGNGGASGGVDTLIPVNVNNGVGNSIFFGANVPTAQAPSGTASYAQTINIMLSC